jgi:diguanylate cyclase (GGDEF)-like protein/PAS domain S-box-containing protein/putative nucleotidyltransferase with HDIG domain
LTDAKIIAGGDRNLRFKYDTLLRAGFVLLMFFILLTSLIGGVSLHNTNINFKETYHGAFTEMSEAKDANTDLVAVHRGMKDVALSRKPSELKAALSDVNKYNTEINRHFLKLTQIEPNNALLLDVIKAYQEWEPIRAKTIELAENGQYAAAADNTRTAGAQQVRLIEQKMQLLISDSQANVERTYQKAQEVSAKCLYSLFILTIFEMTLAVFISVFIGRKLAAYQNQLHEEREQLQITFDSIGDGVITTDIHRNVQKLNTVAEELTGWTAEEAFGKPFDEVFIIKSAINGEKAKDPVLEVLQTNTICQLENHTVLTSREGIIRHIADSAAPIKDKNGKTIGVVMIFRDVTEKKQVQDKLKESETRLISAQSIAHVGNWELDLATNTIWASEEAFNIYGIPYTTPELPLELVQQSVLSEYRDSLDNALIGLMSNKEEYDEQFAIRNLQNGEERFIHSKARLVVDKDGNAAKVAGTIQDITDYKKAEEEILYLSYHDQLTGLSNRRFYEQELRRLDNESNLPLTIVIGDVNGLKLINDTFGHTIGDELLRKAANILIKGCRMGDIIARLGGDEFVILLPKTDAREAEKIIHRIRELLVNEEAGSIGISISFGYDTKIEQTENILDILKNSEDYMYRNKLSESSSIRSKTIDLIMNTLFEKSNREMLHSKRVSTICENIAVEMNFDKDAVNQIRLAGLMHDIGKIGIDEKILNKPDPLNRDEWSEIQRHSEIGYRILSSSNEFSEIARYVLEHHERWNGQGYPRDLTGERISVQARIIAIADAFDAMTSDQPYRKAFSVEEAVKEIERYSGTQFDPEIARIFIEKVLKNGHPLSFL